MEIAWRSRLNSLRLSRRAMCREFSRSHDSISLSLSFSFYHFHRKNSFREMLRLELTDSSYFIPFGTRVSGKRTTRQIGFSLSRCNERKSSTDLTNGPRVARRGKFDWHSSDASARVHVRRSSRHVPRELSSMEAVQSTDRSSVVVSRRVNCKLWQRSCSRAVTFRSSS